jgi:hypothetical protein
MLCWRCDINHIIAKFIFTYPIADTITMATKRAERRFPATDANIANIIICRSSQYTVVKNVRTADRTCFIASAGGTSAWTAGKGRSLVNAGEVGVVGVDI